MEKIISMNEILTFFSWLQRTPNSLLEFFHLTVVCDAAFSRNYTLNSELGVFLRLEMCAMIHRVVLGSSSKPQLCISHTVKRGNCDVE